MIRLIVNADDLGSGPGRDRGIFRAYREGLVTSASLLANGPTSGHAAREALSCGLPVGVHLNLSEGRPLTGPIPGLTDADGNFPGKIGLRRCLSEGAPSDDCLRWELAAQVERVLSTGLRPDHLDSHQHFALYPAATPLLIATARAFGIGAVRLPLPAEPEAADPLGKLGGELSLYRRLAPSAASVIRASGLFTPDGLWGMPALDRLDRKILGEILDCLSAGTWELMTHPGEPDAGFPFSGPNRLIEMEALIDPAARLIVRRRHILLTSFGECVCGS